MSNAGSAPASGSESIMSRLVCRWQILELIAAAHQARRRLLEPPTDAPTVPTPWQACRLHLLVADGAWWRAATTAATARALPHPDQIVGLNERSQQRPHLVVHELDVDRGHRRRPRHTRTRPTSYKVQTVPLVGSEKKKKTRNKHENCRKEGKTKKKCP